MTLALSLLAGYALSFWWLPPLGHAGVWILSLAAALAPQRCALAWTTLLALSLPWIATVQFYLGFPLRCVTTLVSAGLLRLGGLAVDAHATVLSWAGERVLIDAPCSGVQMLWTLLFLGSLVATWQRLSTWQTVRFFRTALLLVGVTNAVRATLLFGLEMKLWGNLPLTHDSIGLALFAGAAATLFLFLPRSSPSLEPSMTACAIASPEPRLPSPGKVSILLLLAVSGGAALIPLVARPKSDEAVTAAETLFPGWDSAPVPSGAERLEFGRVEQRFAERFPGQVAAFRVGRGTWLVRWVAQPTRKLHPSSDCLRAAGYAVKPGPAWAAPDGTLWSAVEATREERRLRARERIFSASEASAGWSDVSSWYWSAALRKSRGPWWAVTVIEEDR